MASYMYIQLGPQLKFGALLGGRGAKWMVFKNLGTCRCAYIREVSVFEGNIL